MLVCFGLFGLLLYNSVVANEWVLPTIKGVNLRKHGTLIKEKMSGINKFLELQKDNSEGDSESVSSYETVPEEFITESERLTDMDKDCDYAKEDEHLDDLSPGITFSARLNYFTDDDGFPLRETHNTVEQIVEERHSFVPSKKTLKSVNSTEYLGYLENNAQLDFIGSELLKQFNLDAVPDSGGTSGPFAKGQTDNTNITVTDLDEVVQPSRKGSCRTERSSGSDDTLQFLESEPALEFLESELLQRLQLVRQDSAKSDSDDNEERLPTLERSRSEQLERIIEEETDCPDYAKDIIEEIIQLQESERAVSDLFDDEKHLEYPKVESIKLCDAVTEYADQNPLSLTMSGDSESSLVINTGLSDDEEFHRIMAMSDLTPEDTGTLANLVPGSDIESEESLTYMADSFCDEVKAAPHRSKRHIHSEETMIGSSPESSTFKVYSTYC